MNEFVIKLEKERIYLDKSLYLSTETLGLNKSVSSFMKGTCWKVRPTRYFKEDKRLVVQILSYSASPTDFEQQSPCPFDVKVLAVPNISTPNLLKCTKRSPVPPPKPVPKPEPGIFPRTKEVKRPVEILPDVAPAEKSKPVTLSHRKIDKEIEVEIDDLIFGDGQVLFKKYVQEVQRAVEIYLNHNVLHPQFSEIRELIKRVIGKDRISVEVSMKILEYEDGIIKSFRVLNAKSSDLDKFACKEIGVGLEDLRLDAYIKDMCTAPSGSQAKITSLQDVRKKLKADSVSPEQFLKKVISRSNIHSLHLQYLSDKHLFDKFHLRIIEKPFSFLFLVEGPSRCHFVLELHSEELATYIWHVDKDKASLRKKYTEIDPIIKSFEKPNRQNYLHTKPIDFSRITHEYKEDRSGFERWKERLLKVLN